MPGIAWSEYFLSEYWNNRVKEFLRNKPNKCYICSSEKKLNVYLKSSKNIHKERDSDLYILCGYCYARVLVFSEENYNNDLWNISKKLRKKDLLRIRDKQRWEDELLRRSKEYGQKT